MTQLILSYQFSTGSPSTYIHPMLKLQIYNPINFSNHLRWPKSSNSRLLVCRLVLLLLLYSILCVATEVGSLGVVLLELNYLFESFSLDENSHRPTKSDLHDVGFEIVVSEPEVEVRLRVVFDAGNEAFFEEVIPKHLNIFDGILVDRHGFVESFVILEIIFLPFFAESHSEGLLLMRLH